MHRLQRHFNRGCISYSFYSTVVACALAHLVHNDVVGCLCVRGKCNVEYLRLCAHSVCVWCLTEAVGTCVFYSLMGVL